MKVDGQNCKLLNLDEREFSCTDYPSGKKIRFTAFGHTGKLTMCEIQVYGSYGLQWSEWSDWSDCSTECHFGIRERTRECDGDYGVCPGEWHQTAWCNSGPCEKHKNLVKATSEVDLSNAFDFSPASLASDQETECTNASAERNSCCAMSRNTIEPVFSINLDSYIEVNTVRLLLPDVFSYNRLQIRVGVSKNIQKSSICTEKSVVGLSGWVEFSCEHKIAAQWVLITVPEKTTSLSLCEVEVFGAPIRKEFKLISAESLESNECIHENSLRQVVSRDLPVEDKLDILNLHRLLGHIS